VEIQAQVKRQKHPRPVTISLKRMSRKELKLGKLLYPDQVIRPANRAECRDGIRPCPYVGCRFHLYLDINTELGSIKLNFPDLEPWEMEETCALDISERDGKTLEEIGLLMNLTRERVRQIEEKALRRLRESGFGDGEEGKEKENVRG